MVQAPATALLVDLGPGRRAQSGAGPAHRRHRRRCDPAGRRSSARAWPTRQMRRFKADPAQHGQGLRHRPVGLVAPPELFLRMACGWLAYPVIAFDPRPARGASLALIAPGRDVRPAALRHRRAAAGGRHGRSPRATPTAATRRASAPSCPARRTPARPETSHERRRRRHHRLRSARPCPTPSPRRRSSSWSASAAKRKLARATPATTPPSPARWPRVPIAEHTEAANDQHYEVPADFFELVLGPRLKYSCCLYATGAETPGRGRGRAPWPRPAPTPTCADGQDILELGCGWGSLSLWMAEHYPERRASPRSPTPPPSAPTSRPRRRSAASPTCSVDHRRHERLRHRRRVRPRRLGGDVRAHGQLARPAGPRRAAG